MEGIELAADDLDCSTIHGVDAASSFEESIPHALSLLIVSINRKTLHLLADYPLHGSSYSCGESDSSARESQSK